LRFPDQKRVVEAGIENNREPSCFADRRRLSEWCKAGPENDLIVKDIQGLPQLIEEGHTARQKQRLCQGIER